MSSQIPVLQPVFMHTSNQKIDDLKCQHLMTSGLLPTNKNDLWNAIFTALVSGIKICPLGHSPESCSMATHIKCENPPPFSQSNKDGQI